MSRTVWSLRSVIRNFFKLRLLWLILVAFFLLSGCVRSDLSIRLINSNDGRLVQHIRLETPATTNPLTAAWIERVADQAVDLGGRLRYASAQHLVLTIPFFNGKDLEQKFNQLLQVELQSQPSSTGRFYTEKGRSQPSASEVMSRLRVRSGNWILWQRWVLSYDVDLQALDRFSQVLAIDPRDLVTLEFSLTTPWGAHSSHADEAAPKIRKQGKQLIWALKPGEMNHVQAVFWLPSPLGIGTVLIVLLILGGMLVKTQRTRALTNA
jgi:hypothetical protein